MGNIVKKIVLTGGPCAGKSSSLDLINKYLSSKGYCVLIVNESATELINSGIKPFGENKISMYDFQNVILKYQLDKENIIESVAKKISDKDVIIIYDRGVIDNKAYVGQKDFDKLLNINNLKEIDLLNRYDLVIHLETGAKGRFYTLDNNSARSESKEDAIKMCDKTYYAWINHRNLKRVKCFDNFHDKQSFIINIINKEFYKSFNVQNKYLISFDKSLIDDEIFYINQYYLDMGDEIQYSDDSIKLVEHRIREVLFRGKKSYYYTIKQRNVYGESLVIKDDVITEEEYNYWLSNYRVLNEVNKIRKYVVYNDIQYNVDIFFDGNVVLECNDVTAKTLFDIKSDVTNNEKFLNINIGRKKEKILEKKYTS